MVEHEIWRAEPAGVLASESHHFRLVVQAPDIRNDYKKCAGSSDGAKTYDTTAT